MASYRLTAQRRKQVEIAQTKQRWQQAQNLAQQAATFLRKNYGVETVILFGSTLERDRFHLTSDLDLAISELPPEQFFTAVAQLQDLSPNFKVDLIQLEHCQESLQKAILAEGRFL